MRKLFGTDGIRGIADKYPLDSKTVKNIGLAAAEILKTKDSHAHPVLIGRDTRESGAGIVSSLKKGLLSEGIEVWDIGVIPTPGIAYLVRKYPALTGIVVSASHNPYQYNGIKFFSHKGIKLSDSVEYEIEKQIEKIAGNNIAPGKKKARAKMFLAKEYAGFLKSSVPGNFNLKGMVIVVDCANGATYKIAPAILSSFGAKVIAVNISPNGKNINKDCGSLHPEKLAQEVLKHRAHCGIAFDGDGDRVMFVDEKGIVRDGDYLLSILSIFFKQKKKLKNNMLVTTVMANLGLFKTMEQQGIKTMQTSVGDRYVYEKMLQTKAVIGGEQSGHIIFREILPTGDGILSALQVLYVIRESGKTLGELSGQMKKYPQILLNTPVANKVPIDSLPMTSKIIKNAQDKLKSNGRILVRYSGTENLLRVMIEGLSKKMIAGMANNIVNTAKKEISVSV